MVETADVTDHDDESDGRLTVFAEYANLLEYCLGYCLEYCGLRTPYGSGLTSASA